MRHLRRPSYAAVVAHLALAVALSTGAAAAVVITGANVRNGSLTGADIKAKSLTGGNIANGTLSGAELKKHSVAVDRLSGMVPVDTSKYYDKTQSDSRFLGVNATAATAASAVTAANAANAALLGGLDPSAFARGKATFYSTSVTFPFGTNFAVILKVPGFATVHTLGCSAGDASVQVDNADFTTPGAVWYERQDFLTGLFGGTGWGSVTSGHGTVTWSAFTLTRAPGAGVAQIQAHGAVTNGACSYAITAVVSG
jgi:hypothetical protein